MKSTSPSRIALALTVLATLAGVVLFVIPTSWERSEYEWAPTVGSLDASFVMTATPDLLTFQVPCDVLRTQSFGKDKQWTVFRTEGASRKNTSMSLLMYGDSLLTQFGAVPVGVERLRVGVGCDVVFEYQRATNTMRVTAGTESLVRPLDAEPVSRGTEPVGTPTIGGFHVDSGLRGAFTLRIVAQPSQNFVPAWRIAAAVLGLLAVASAIFILCRRGPPPPSPTVTPATTKRWTGSDTFVAIGAFFGLLVAPPLFDDGWVLTTIRNYADSGFFSNYYSAQAALQPQGFWWATLERVWLTSVDTPVFMMRVPSMILLVLTWWYLRRRLIDQLVPQRSQVLVRILLAAAAVVTALAWAPTLRPEPLIGLLLAVQIVVVYEFTRYSRAWLLPLAAVLAALAITTHQTGWTVVTAALALIPALVRWLRETPRKSAVGILAIAVLGAVAVTLCTTFAITDYSAWNLARSLFASETTHDLFLVEGKRLGDLSTHDAGVAIRVLSVGLALLAALGFLARRAVAELSPSNAAGWAALAGLGGLALTSSKWIWHFGILLPITVTLGAIALSWVCTGHGWRTTRLYVSSAAVLIVGVFSTRAFVSWGPFASPSVDTSELLESLPTFARPNSMAFWIVLLIMLVIVSVLIARRYSRPRPAATLALSACAVTFVALTTSFMPILVDSVRNPTTSWPHQVATSFQGGACGIAGSGGLPIATETVALDVFGDPSLGTIDGSIPMIPALLGAGDSGRLTPYPGAIVYIPTPGAVGPTSTPWFASQEQPMQTWVQLPANGAEFDIQWNVNGRLVTEKQRRAPDVPVWSVVPLTPPAGTLSFRIMWNTAAGPASVTRPVSVRSTSNLTNIVGTSTVWNNPDTHLMAPCFPMPPINEGRFGQFRYSIGIPTINNSAAWRISSIATELACTGAVEPADRLCIYKLDFAEMPGLSRRVASVRQ